MIRKSSFLMLLLAVMVSFHGLGQILSPVTWSFGTEKTGEREYELILTAKMDQGWHLYSTNIPAGGPIPTSFRFTLSDDYELAGELIVPESIEEFDKAFEMDIHYFSGQAVFRQKIRIKTAEAITVRGELEFMACNDTRCTPPDVVEFSFDIKADVSKTTISAGKHEASQVEQPDSRKDTVRVLAGEAGEATIEPLVIIPAEQHEPEKKTDNSSLWTFFFIALGVGFVGLLTPCVYPMIPMTVTFFMNASQNKLKAKTQAVFFGLSIIFIYTFIGVLVSAIFGADTIKRVSEHWITNLVFFLLFATFAASFFGMFEMILPSWLTNKSDQQADKGGYIGSFFMALTLVLVSFSCTAPFVGGILVEAATGQVIKPIVGMFGFSLAFGIVFTVLALFPSWLNRMPRSGGWLNSVKVVLAFLILAIGMKYLLVPNQALHWGITREVYLGVWIVLFTLMGFYLLGKIRFSHDSPVEHIAVPRLLLVIASFAFALYLVPGLFGAPLKAVSGYIPAESSWDLDDIIRESTSKIGNTPVRATGLSSRLCDKPKYTDIFSLPHGLEGYYDLEQGLACAKKLGKPVFLDIKGHACTNCKVIEKNVWSDPEVLRRLNNEFVIIALYVDERTELPESEWVTSTFDGKVKKTIGRKNTDYQITMFGTNAQPYYVILDDEGAPLGEAMAFEPDAGKYAAFLDRGLQAYNEKKR